jgi:hypothetical protein
VYDIKQSTAITVPFFVHDASGDAVTGLSDGSFTKRISKNGAAFGAMTVTITEMENGWYSIPLSTAHSNTLGLLSITFTNAGAKQVNLQWRVQAKLTDDLNDFDAATDAVANVTLVATTTTNSDMRGTDSALLAASINLTAGAVDNVTTVATTTTNTDMRGTDSALLAADINLTAGAVDNVTLVATTTTNTDMRGTDAAQVNAEVVDVLFTDTIPELAQAIPSATPTIATAVMLPYMTLRNQLTSTSTTLTVSNDAGTVITKKALSDDGTTYTEAEMVAGP